MFVQLRYIGGELVDIPWSAPQSLYELPRSPLPKGACLMEWIRPVLGGTNTVRQFGQT